MMLVEIMLCIMILHMVIYVLLLEIKSIHMGRLFE